MSRLARRAAGHPRAGRTGSTDSGRPGATQLIEKGSAVVAPVTVLTALFVYFGFVRTSSYYSYFGVNMGVLKLSVQDYVLRSVDVSFGAVARLALFGALLITLDRVVAVVLARRATGDRTDRALRWSLTTVGVVLVVLGLTSAVNRAVVAVLSPLIGSAVLAAGAIVVLRFNSTLLEDHDRNSGRRTTVLIVVVLVISGFWAATIYAQDLGLEAVMALTENAQGCSPKMLNSGAAEDRSRGPCWQVR